MGGSDWKDTETAVLLFYHSRGLSFAACGDLVSLKCNSSRTKVACQGKLSRLRAEHPDIYDQDSKTLNNAATDNYILNLEVEDLQTSIAMGEEERVILQKVAY